MKSNIMSNSINNLTRTIQVNGVDIQINPFSVDFLEALKIFRKDIQSIQNKNQEPTTTIVDSCNTARLFLDTICGAGTGKQVIPSYDMAPVVELFYSLDLLSSKMLNVPVKTNHSKKKKKKKNHKK